MHRTLYASGLGIFMVASDASHAGISEFSWEISGATNPKAPVVVLLHGLNRSYRSMRSLAKVLAAGGYRVVNMDYPSSQFPLDELGRQLGRSLVRCCSPAPAGGIHFITHSLGGIVLRVYAGQAQPDQIRQFPIARVVMLAPPNRGSELTDKLRNIPFYKILTGPAGQQIGTDSDSVPNRLGPVSFDLGVIAGRSSYNPLYSWLIPGLDDGKVAVSKTRVPGLKDFIVLQASHSFMMSNKDVLRQSLLFLQQGHFDHPQSK